MKNFFMGSAFAIGLILAGSDGEWWPWVNFGGILIIGAVGILASYIREKTGDDMLYTKEQTDALEGAIAKWRGICEEGKADHGTIDCPCCKIWETKEDFSLICKGCPIEQYTGVTGCDLKPYEERARLLKKVHNYFFSKP